MRVHHWVKNLLVFVPVLTAHQLGDPAAIRAALLAFVAMSLCASAIYIVNDVYDLEADRQHPEKRRRPLAAGEVSVGAALGLAVPLLIIGATVALAASGLVLELVGLYVAVSLAYSHVLKKVAILDVLCLATLYTLRVFVGGAAPGIDLTPWRLAFTTFLFISLAIVKRVAELRDVRDSRQEGMGRRQYQPGDLEVLQVVGTTAGQMAVLVLALYIQSENVVRLYRHPNVLWLLCVAMFYWITRIWLKLHRGEVRQDPVVYALQDGASYAVGAAAVLITILAAR